MWLELNGQPISPWHDVPLHPGSDNTVVNFVVEIPRWQPAKIEIKRTEPLNPIFHDDKNDAPRFKENVWPHKAMPFLYGSIPQTWENDNIKHNFTGFKGDKDPMDLFDIGQDKGYTGQVKQVKILGGLSVIDDEETDWKIMGIDVTDPLAPLVNSVEDVEKYRPGMTAAFYEWFAGYEEEKTPIVGNKYQSQATAVQQVEESHHFWQDLVSGKEKPGKINFNQTSNPELKSYVPCKEATPKLKIPPKSDIKPAAAIPAKYEGWFFYSKEGKLLNPDMQ